jgi:beta-lactam-binding protein with PASTA domain
LTNAAPAGRVLQQSPRAGSRIEVGGTISLTVAKPLPKVPSVVGKTLANAKSALAKAGFKVGKVTQQTSSQQKGTVISQSPASGTSARPGRAVSLVTAKPAPAPSSNCTPGYSPCLAPASDYDCAGGSGDGPKYVYGTVRVTGSDPYGLDSDNDGYGCE